MNSVPAYIVFSDLDGTLLDHRTYRYDKALRGISILKKKGIPLVLVSSKTFPEISALHKEIGLAAPFAFENGGGIAFPDEASEGGMRIEILGAPIEKLRADFRLLQGRAPSPAVSILDLSMDDLRKRTGLDARRIELALQRKASLPFIFTGSAPSGHEEIGKINRTLHAYGYAITKGGRFYHFIAEHATKGEALRKIVVYYKTLFQMSAIPTIGIGDSENDIDMFRAVSVPVLVKKFDHTYTDTGMDIRKTASIGPEGFSEAIESLIGA